MEILDDLIIGFIGVIIGTFFGSIYHSWIMSLAYMVVLMSIIVAIEYRRRK